MSTVLSQFVRRSLSAALLLAVSGAGCGTVESDMNDDMMGGNPVDPADTTAPTIVDSVPAADAIGITADQKIMITFSEQMDPVTVEAAYSSTDLPADKVSMSWNEAGTVLTISPNAPLAYMEGGGVDLTQVPRVTYALTIGGGAADLVGNELGTPMVLKFSTKRRLEALFYIDVDLTRSLLDTSVLAGASLYVGDNSTGKRYTSYLTFDMSTLPAGAEIESASMGGKQTAPYGAPYGNLGAVMAQHLSYTSMTNIAAVQPISLPGPFSEDANTLFRKSLDVTNQVSDDVTNRAARSDRSQYRLQIDTATNSDGTADAAVFTKDTFSLDVWYIID